ncbi:MAG: YggS family pyridoxal phosphate-dependent enzyme [Actinomycetota bacterium]
MIDPDRLKDALAEARERLDEATVASGRPPGSVEIVVAGKYVAAEDAPALVAAGVRVVGENRLQDLMAKRAAVGDALTFDFIGHLQRRKVRSVLSEVRLIHSLDSVALAREIAARAEGPTRVLVEVNVGGENTKPGIVPADLHAFVQEISGLSALVLGGLMGMPPPQSDPERSRPYFAALRTMLDDLAADWSGRHDFRDLSMGTSQDYLVAAREGATIVRVGRGVIDRARMS